MTNVENWDRCFKGPGDGYAFTPSDTDNLTNWNELCAYVAWLAS